MRKTLLLILVGWHGLNGLAMIAMPELWYQTVPGVTATGPFNGHFVADIAIAFLASAAGLAVAAARFRISAPAALVAPAVFLGGHAVLHLAEFFHGHMGMSEIARDTLLILIPGLLPAIVLWQDWQTAKQGETA